MASLFLSEKDAAILQELINRSGRSLQTSVRAASEDSLHQAPEVYIVRTPDNGIPALTNPDDEEGEDEEGDFEKDKPGKAECDVYYLKVDGGDVSLVKAGFQLTVFNLSKTELKDQWLTVVRDKYGRWLPVVGGGGGGVSVGWVVQENILGRSWGQVDLEDINSHATAGTVDVYNPFHSTVELDSVVLVGKTETGEYIILAEDCPQETSEDMEDA